MIHTWKHVSQNVLLNSVSSVLCFLGNIRVGIVNCSPGGCVGGKKKTSNVLVAVNFCRRRMFLYALFKKETLHNNALECWYVGAFL